MPKNFSQKGFTSNFLGFMKDLERNKLCCLDFLTQVYTTDSDTVTFTGLGTKSSPLIATSLSSAITVEDSVSIHLTGDGTVATPLQATLLTPVNGLQLISGAIGLGGTLTENTTINNGTSHFNILFPAINFDSGQPATMTLNASNNNFIQYVSANAGSLLDIYIHNTLDGPGSGAGFTLQNSANQLGGFGFSSPSNHFQGSCLYLLNNTGAGGIAFVAPAGPVTFNNGNTEPFTEYARFTTAGQLGIGTTTPSASITLVGSVAGAAGTGSIKLLPGTLLVTPELGLLEFTDDGTTGHLYITLNQAGVLTRVQIV